MLFRSIHSSIALSIHFVILYILLKYVKLGIFALVIGNIIFPLMICVLNWLYLKKTLDYQQEIKKTFIVPLISSIIMGITIGFTYKVTYSAININSISTLVAIIVAIIVYFSFLLLLKGITEDELYQLPKGTSIIKIARKLHLLR